MNLRAFLTGCLLVWNSNYLLLGFVPTFVGYHTQLCSKSSLLERLESWSSEHVMIICVKYLESLETMSKFSVNDNNLAVDGWN